MGQSHPANPAQGKPVHLQTQGALQLFQGSHEKGVLTVAFLRDNQHAVSSGVDDQAILWDLVARRESTHFRGKRFRFQSVAVSPHGDRLLTPAEDGALYWQFPDATVVRPLGLGTDINRVALSKDGSLAAASDRTGQISVWNLATGASLAQLTPHTGLVIGLAFSPDDAFLLTVGDDNRVCVSPIQAPADVRCSGTAVDGATSAVAFAEGTSLLALGTESGILHLWDWRKQRQRKQFRAHQRSITAIAFRGDSLVSGSNDQKLRAWNAKTGTRIGEYRILGDYVSAVALSSDARRAVVGTSSGVVALLTFGTSEQQRR